MEPKPLYHCECGFQCYTLDQEMYHRDGTCLSIRRMLGVIAARERLGHRDHAGIQINGFLLLATQQRTA